jgi:oligopeptide/dipeptide ABC transporter ATP-binding protein
VTETDPAAVLSVRDLRVEVDSSGGRLELLHGLSFDVYPGEAVAIVGESGAGKSLAMMAILGLLPRPPFRVTSGRALLSGAGDLLAMNRRQLNKVRGKDVGVVFQDPSLALNPVMRVGAQVAESVRLHEARSGRRQAAARAVRLLRQVEVPEPELRARQYPHQFSGGMRQRSVIAMAIANHPRLLIADEPTTALDSTVQAQILEVLKRARADTGAALILITHDLGVVAEVADRVITLYAGSMVESGDVITVLTAPSHPYTRGLLRSIPTLGQASRRLVAIPGLPASPAGQASGCAFQPRCAVCAGRAMCTDRVPQLRAISAGHEAACHFPGEPEAGGHDHG